MTSDSPLVLRVKFNGQIYAIDDLDRDMTIQDFKDKIYKLTRVPPTKQKLLGLVAERGKELQVEMISGKTVSDRLSLGSLVIKPTTKIMLIGSTEEAVVCIHALCDTFGRHRFAH